MRIRAYIAAIFMFGLCLPNLVSGQIAIDTLVLKGAEIGVFRMPTEVARLTGTVHIIPSEQLNNNVSPDLQDVLNHLPGVKMETRGYGGSRRIQIRSSGMRSPYAVRNTFLLCDGFVLTGAGGTSPLELFDPQFLDRVEILLGPSGALFGGGYGGAISAISLPTANFTPTEKASVQWHAHSLAQGTVNRGAGNLGSGIGFSIRNNTLKNAEWHFRGSQRNNPGYRSHEANQRAYFDIHRRWKSTGNHLNHLWLGVLDAKWDLPGSISWSNAETDPTATPGRPYDAHVDRQRAWIGWSSVKTRESVRSGLWIWSAISDKFNPFGTSPFYQGEKTEAEAGMSVRWWRSQTISTKTRWKLSWDQSIILRTENLAVQERNQRSHPANMRYDILTNSSLGWAGTGLRFEHDTQWMAELQWAWEGITRHSDGTFLNPDMEDAYLPFDETYKQGQWLPRISISSPSTRLGRWFAQYAKGLSHPTSFEVVDPENNTFASLLPEKAHSLEAGWKLYRPDAIFKHFNITMYHQTLNDPITLVEGPTDGMFLDNDAAIWFMQGIESAATWQKTWSGMQQKDLTVYVHGHLNHHVRTLPTTQLPGTPLHGAGTLITWKQGSWKWSVDYLWNDRAPLRDDLRDWSRAYHRIHARIDKSSGPMTWSLGIRNITNALYSDWLQVNAYGGKYHNPAPGRSVWLSVAFRPNR